MSTSTGMTNPSYNLTNKGRILRRNRQFVTGSEDP
jgi:hypothetical protein